MSPNKVLRIIIVVVVFLVAASGILFHVFGIDVVNHLPHTTICPFRVITGLPCPGCGMARAFISIGHLDIKSALRFNPFSIPLFLALILYLCPVRVPAWLRHEYIPHLILFGVCAVWIRRILRILI